MGYREAQLTDTDLGRNWLTGNGSLLMLNNGIEFAATYVVVLLILFFFGTGRYFSIDHWLRLRFLPTPQENLHVD